jgi:hypothetical protein
VNRCELHPHEFENALVGESVRRDIRKMSILHLFLHIADDSSSKVHQAAFEEVVWINPVVVDEEDEAMTEPGSEAMIPRGGSLNLFNFIVQNSLLDVCAFIEGMRKLHQTSNCYQVKKTINCGDIHDVRWSLLTWGMGISIRSDCEHRKN